MMNIVSGCAGLIFGFGLLLSGMAQPEKVLSFLDVAGVWDPSLAFVMVGALFVSSVAFVVARKRQTSLLGCSMQLPTAKLVDQKLVLGSILFGIGWGLAGVCPGPSLVVVGLGVEGSGLFVLAMLVGMWLYQRFFTAPSGHAANK